MKVDQDKTFSPESFSKGIYTLFEESVIKFYGNITLPGEDMTQLDRNYIITTAMVIC
jgi:hypothetical protein